MYRRTVLFATTWFAFSAGVLYAQAGAIPVENTTGPPAVLQGYGLSPGGAGGDVYHVTRLDDAGPGTLRDAIATQSGPRTIVFDVGGVITLLSPLYVDKPWLTIDGSTAPAPGITIRSGNIDIGRFVIAGTHDIVLRYLRFEGPWRANETPTNEADLLCVEGSLPPDHHTHHIILDHLTLQNAANGAPCFLGNVSDVTVSWCLIYHSYRATEVGKESDPSGQRSRISMHHNVYAGNGQHNPQVHSATNQLDFVNNIIYDFRQYGMRIRNAPGGLPASANVINNYFAPGSSPNAFRSLVYGLEAGRDEEDDGPPVNFLPQGTILTDTAMGPLYVAGNVLPQANYDQFSTVSAPLPVPLEARATTVPATELRTWMLPFVGMHYRSIPEQSLIDSMSIVLGGTPPVAADLDGDRDVDDNDIGQWAVCRTRAGIAPHPACAHADLDKDNDVDQDDLGIFQRCYGWSGAALPPTCLIDPAIQTLGSPPPGNQTGTGGDFYVATNGNDSWSGRLPAPNANGTDGPLRTIQKATELVAPGSTCVIFSGVYSGSVSITRNGTAVSPITFRAAEGHQVVLDGQNVHDYGITLVNASWIIIDGITVRNYRRNGIWLVDFSDHNIIRNCTVHDCGDTGIHVRGGDDCLIEYNEVFNNTTGIFISWRDSNQNYPYRNRVRYNLAYNHGVLDPESGDGIGSDASQNGIFEYNICWNNRDDGIDVSIKSRDNVIAYNIVLFNGYPETVDGDGNGIKVSTNGGGGHIVHHNFALLSRRSGIDQDIQSGAPRNYFYNNTAFGNGHSGLMIDSGGRGDPGNCAVVKNNLLAGNNRLNIGRPDLYACCTMPLLESDYNFIADGNTSYGGTVTEGPHSRFGDPRLMNPLATIDLGGTGDIATRWAYIWNQVTAAFAVQPVSPCVGAGVVIPGVTTKPFPNIGAVE